ncbi:MAG: hypothetical protein L7U49_05045 [Litoricolaceae bacterium]|nr:hypothetical protein [Litorivicinaceae bacterium]
MELKRVIGKDSKHAMEMVQQQFGSDALVISSQKVNQRCEMIVAVDIAPDPALIDVPDHQLLETPKSQTPRQRFSSVLHGEIPTTATMENDRAHEIVELFKSEMHLLKKELAQLRSASAWRQDLSEDETPIQQSITQHSIPSASKMLILEALKGITDPTEATSKIHDLFASSLLANDHDPLDLSGVHAFLGLTGSGKTTFIGKLVAQLVDASKVNDVTVISYADDKLGAWNQIQLMCSKFGVKCFRCPNPQMLETVLREIPNDHSVLIDTSGLGLDQTHQAIQAVVPDALMHLVVNAEIARSSCDKLLETQIAWDSINVAQMTDQPDMWVLINALSQQQDLQLWLKTTNAELNTPAELIEVDQLLKEATQIFQWTQITSPEPELEEAESGRQTGEETSTLDYLAGLRADPDDRNLISASIRKQP